MSNKLWGGRFEGKIDPGFAEFNNSYRFDRRLFEADVTASIAYCQALENARVITAQEGAQIRDALDTILRSGADEVHSAEDVHSFVEARLIVGDIRRRSDRGCTDNHTNTSRRCPPNAGCVYLKNRWHGRTARRWRRRHVERLRYTPWHCRIGNIADRRPTIRTIT